MNRIQIGLWLVIAGSVAGALFTAPGLVRFWPFSAAEFVQLIAPLFLVALFIERALEVFLTAWRGPEAAKHDQAVKDLKAEAEKGALDVKRLADARKDRTGYKCGTQRIAFLGGLAMGVIVSALGVRALGLFVDPAAFSDLSSRQQAAFNTMDVVLTGAALGGGSEALHKLVSIFTNFMDTTAKKAKGETE